MEKSSFLDFLKADNNQFSMTRLTILLLTLTYIGQSTYIVSQTRTIPDIPTAVAGLLVGLYGFNRANISLGTAPKVETKEN